MEDMQKVDFRFIFDDDYRPSYANGAYGGLTPKGEVVINFFTERWAIPRKETDALLETGQLGAVLSTEPANLPVVRTISSGVIMSKETAKEIHDWLGKILENGSS